MRLVLWDVLFMTILDRLCSGLDGVGQGVWKRKKDGEIVIVSLSTLYHGLNDCI